MIQYFIEAGAFVEELLISAEASAEALALTRHSLTAMRWGKNAVDAIQMYNYFTEGTTPHVDYEDGEAAYLILFASDLIQALGLDQSTDNSWQIKADQAVIEAVEHTYSVHTSGNSLAIITTFSRELGRRLQLLGFDVYTAAKMKMDNAPLEMKWTEPYMRRLADPAFTGDWAKGNAVLDDLGLSNEKREALISAIRQGVVGASITELISTGLTGSRAQVNAIIKNDSVYGMMLRGALSVMRRVKYATSTGDGGDFLSFGELSFVEHAIEKEDRDPVRPTLSIPTDVTRLIGRMEALKLGYVWDKEQRTLVKDPDAIIPPSTSFDLGTNEKAEDPSKALEKAVGLAATLGLSPGKALGRTLAARIKDFKSNYHL